jgi:serine/threonine protein kinase
MDREFNAKLSDFGASRAADGAMAMNAANTVAYAPGELLQGGRPTVKSDVYSLGLLIYFVITGNNAFDPTQSLGCLKDAVKEGADLQLPASVKPELALLIRSMCSLDPEARPPSATVFDVMCEHQFRFFEGIDAVELWVGLTIVGAEDRPGSAALHRLWRLESEVVPGRGIVDEGSDCVTTAKAPFTRRGSR